MMGKPKIRFKGYNEDWEQRKLGDLVLDHNAGIYISKENYGEGINVIGVGNIYDSDIFNGEIYRLGPVNDDKFLLEEDDIIYGESSLVPEGIARTVCVGKNGAGSAFAWHTRRVKLDNNIVNSHVATLELNYLHDVRKYLVSVSTQTALTGITTDGYFGTTLVLPSVEEQHKISDYFKSLDHLITLHQHKCDEMKKLKKYMLQKMFPQYGKKVPEIRFDGFTNDWEQRKLGEITDVRDGTHDSPKYVQEGHPFITSKNVSNGFINYDDVQYVTDADYQKINRRSKVEVHDILMGMIGTIGNLALIQKEPDFAIKNVALIKYTGDVDYEYLYQALQADCVTNQLFTGMDGGTQKFVSLKKIRELDIPFPEEWEQKKIGDYFSNLDHLITLHQHKCDELQNLKKYMLQNMFV